ncbi:CHASE2 domain-containing protein [Pseudorhodoferax sp. Leaf274]|uniref:CHASE2 domain-containing protein n=1 Tax=Pseudorhodoferax sp. Leaf274 TaxID=1736318 RepID=UPI00070389DC|nr:adenylate/guanylate cyclase domain-containing protein [Pseudorhodoferax sp. Leaf274]KQP38010.1 hypothetical protein ASF44_12395 [Pseudorhodoferax sp. Leaf274]
MNTPPSRRRWRKTAQAAGWLALLVLLAGVLLSDPIWLRGARHAVFDQYQRWQPREWQDTAVRIVDVDEESLARLGQWPWPRSRMAQIVVQAQAGKAAALGFDVVFAEADRSSPAEISRHWNLSPAQREVFAGVEDPDEAFARSMDGGGVVLGFALRPQAPATPAALAGPPRFVEVGRPAAPFLRRFGEAITAVQPLADHAAGHGALAFLPDSDGVVRRVPLLLRVGDSLVPSLVTELLRVAQRERSIVVRSTVDGVQDVRIGSLSVPTTETGEMWVHYAPAAPARTIPAWKLLAGQVPSGELDGKILLLGSSAQGLLDLRFGTLGHLLAGVEVHAQALEQILTGGLLSRPDWARALEALCLLLGGLAVGVLAMTTRPAVASLATGAILLGVGAASWWAFRQERLLLDPLAPGLGIACAFLVPSLLRHHTSEKRRRWVSQAFSRYVSPNLVAHIVDHPDELALGGRRQTCSFIFTDLAGFTGLMEDIDPGEAVGLLNEYLDGMIGVAFRYQGTLDRIVGDGIAIMFSAPIAQADHRERAVACAIDLQRFATAFAQRQQARGVPFGHTRIGVHGGEVIVGNFGGNAIFDYRALGDPVNTASRLESANKSLGTRLCMSEAVMAACPALAVRCVGRLIFKGKNKPLLVFQPANDGLDLPVDGAALERYAQAYALMAAEDPRALAAFEALAQETPVQPLVRFHLERLRRGELGDTIRLLDK